MQTQVTTERQYTVGYFKPGQKESYGISVSVSGDKKAKALREAKELLIAAQSDALEVYQQLLGKETKKEED